MKQCFQLAIKSIEVSRSQFPLVLAWATTIHKVKGLTMEQIVLDMADTVLDKGLAFSCVKTLEGLLSKTSRLQISS